MIVILHNNCPVCRVVLNELQRRSISSLQVEINQDVADTMWLYGGFNTCPVMTDGHSWWAGFEAVRAVVYEHARTNSEPFDWQEAIVKKKEREVCKRAF